MRKITDSEYFLPTIEATQFIELLTGGSTEPMLIRGICRETGIKDDYVVKYRKVGRMTEKSCTLELLASFMATQLTIKTPEPVVVNFSEQFIQTMKGKDGYRNAANSIGFNYGSNYLKPNLSLVTGFPLNDELLLQAFDIFIFDILISNADRNTNKPNLVYTGKDFYVIDHEVAFGYIFDISPNNEPWKFGAIERGYIPSHYFYKYLVGKNNLAYDDFMNRMDSLNENFWDSARRLIPDEWNKSVFDKIQEYTLKILNHKELFFDEIRKILA